MPDFTILDRCVICGGKDLSKVLDLGEQALANAFHDGTKEQTRYPLYLNSCQSCGHLQQGIAVDPDILFKDYPYVSGTTKTLGDYFDWFVDKVEKDFPGRKLHVLEIACNDGSLLKRFGELGHAVFGIDPAENIQPLAVASGIHTTCDYWDEGCLSRNNMAGFKFDVIIAMNVLGHVADPVAFMRACRDALAVGGRIYIQTSQAHMVENGEFDTSYHEHISFFSREGFGQLAFETSKDMDGGEVKITSIDVVPIHGLSFLAVFEITEMPLVFLSGFYNWVFLSGLYNRDHFTERLQSNANEICDTARAIRLDLRPGRNIGYGAAAKGMVFLQRVGLDLVYVIDDAPLKQGKFCPGTNIPVLGSDVLKTAPHGLAIWILAWNFRDEIISRIKAVRPDNGDIFITCFPKFKVSS